MILFLPAVLGLVGRFAASAGAKSAIGGGAKTSVSVARAQVGRMPGGAKKYAKAVGDETKALTDHFKKLGKGAIAAGIAMVMLPKAFLAFGRATLNRQKRLAQFSGSIAASMAGVEMGRLGRDFKTAGETAGTTKELAASQNRIEDAMQPFSSLATNVQNWAATKLNEIGASMLETFRHIPGIKQVLDKMEREGKKQGELAVVNQFIADLANRGANVPKVPDGGNIPAGGAAAAGGGAKAKAPAAPKDRAGERFGVGVFGAIRIR